MNKNLLVKILKIENEPLIIENVRFVRILSKKYNLLIMRDYLPIIGELDGSIEIVGIETVKYENIKGYYINRDNEFSLIIKGNI